MWNFIDVKNLFTVKIQFKQFVYNKSSILYGMLKFQCETQSYEENKKLKL